MIRFLWECSSGGGRVVRIDSVVVIVVQYLGLSKGVLRLRVREMYGVGEVGGVWES